MESAPIVARLEDVHKSFKLGDTWVRALRGVDLEVRKGEFTALLGASGSGKSTMLNLLGALDRPDAGKIWISGRETDALDETERSRLRNRQVGFIFQSFNLVPVLTVAENIELPLRVGGELSASERKRRVDEVIGEVGLTAFRDAKPPKLSGGQRQRVAIARALVHRPALVLADEPTASLDSETTHKIIDLMMELNEKRGVTFLFSTHDEKLMNRVTRTVRLQDGRIL